MKVLGLEVCADTMVGDQMIRGISGGQRKRVTTGERLVGPAKIYVGPLGRHSCHLINYFEKGIEGVSKIKDGYNPVTWMLEVTTSAQETALGVDFTEVHRSSELYSCTYKFCDIIFKRKKALIKESSTPRPSSKDLYFPTQYSVILHPMHGLPMEATLVILAQSTIYCSEISFHNLHNIDVWDNVLAPWFQKTRQQDLFNAMGSMYATVLFLEVQNASSVQPVVAIERTVFHRERAAGMYSALPYAFGQVAIELPYIFAQAAVYGVIVYAMIGFEWRVAKFFWYLFFMCFTFLYYTFYGMMTVAVTPNHHIASIVTSAFTALWNLFSGFIVPRSKMLVWWRWHNWACPFAWTLYGLVTSQFGDVKYMLDKDETIEDFLRRYFDFKHELLGVVAAVVVGFTLLLAFIFAFFIKKFNFPEAIRRHSSPDHSILRLVFGYKERLICSNLNSQEDGFSFIGVGGT